MEEKPFSAIIVAMDKANGIGLNNELLAKIPADLKRFREITSESVVVMGRKTYESLPAGALPDRKNLVITSDMYPKNYPGCMIYSDLEQIFLDYASERLFFIGGAKLYAGVLDRVDRLYITRIEHSFEHCDTFFPQVDWTQWELLGTETLAADEKNPYRCTFLEYQRRKY